MTERLDDRGAHAGPAQATASRRHECGEADAKRQRMGGEKLEDGQKAGHDRIKFGIEVAQDGAELRQTRK